MFSYSNVPRKHRIPEILLHGDECTCKSKACVFCADLRQRLVLLPLPNKKRKEKAKRTHSLSTVRSVSLNSTTLRAHQKPESLGCCWVGNRFGPEGGQVSFSGCRVRYSQGFTLEGEPGGRGRRGRRRTGARVGGRRRCRAPGRCVPGAGPGHRRSEPSSRVWTQR